MHSKQSLCGDMNGLEPSRKGQSIYNKCIGSSPYALAHIVGPLVSTPVLLAHALPTAALNIQMNTNKFSWF